MSFFQPVHIPAIVRPPSFAGIYSEDDYMNDMVQRTANDYALAHAHVQAFERQRDHHYHPHHHQHHQHRFGGPHRGRFAPASLHNFSYGFAPSCTRPALYTPHRRPAAYSPEQLAYRVCQEEERQRALNRQLEAIARQQELAREREAQRRRALAEAAAREQVRAACAARIQARQAHDQEILLALLGQLGLTVAPAQSTPAQVNREQPSAPEREARAAHTARIQARQARDKELLFALLGQLGLAVDPVQSAPIAPPVNKPQPSVQISHNAAPTAAALAPSPVPVDHKGKGKAVDVPAEIPTLSPNPVPVPAKVPTLKEELEARIRSETDPEVRESLVLLYSDIFDARQPAQPVAGPSGHKHGISFEIPATGPSSSTTTSPVPVKIEEQVDIPTIPVPAEKPEIEEPKTEEHDGASLHRTPALPPSIAAKLLKFYHARRARTLSLAQITDVEETLRKLEGALEFPAHLDFVDCASSPSPSGTDTDTASALAYTANNSPIHAYEHALNDLLTRLDAVESNGDIEVRGRRKEVVKEVERALEAMERRIEESRERSQERARRGSVSSQVSDASVMVTPYNVHSSNMDEVEVAVTTEDVLVEVEESKTTALEAEDASVAAEDAPLRVEVSEPVPAVTDDTPDVAIASPSVDSVEPDYPPLAAGIPDSGADVHASSLSDKSIHGDLSSPIDDNEDLDHIVVSSSQAPSDVCSPVDEAAIPSSGGDNDVVEQKPSDAEAACPDVQSETVAADITAESDDVVVSPLESTEEANSISLTSLAVPEAISRIESSATDTTFITAEVDSVPLSAADDDTTFFTAGTATPSEPSPTPPPAPAPPSDSESASSTGEETFLLSSTPLADEQPKKQRRPSTSESIGDDSDELEIIGREELEVARNGSDWPDVESESRSDLEVVE